MLTALLVCLNLLADDRLEPGSWEKMERLESESPRPSIYIFAKDGSKRECSIGWRFFPNIMLHIAGDDYGWSEDVGWYEKKILCLPVPRFADGSRKYLERDVYEEDITKITTIDNVSGEEKTVYISKREAWRQDREKAGLSIPPLMESEPIPGHWDIAEEIEARKIPIILYTQSGDKFKCRNWALISATWENVYTSSGSTRKHIHDRYLKCSSDADDSQLEIEADLVDRVTIIDKDSGAEKTIFISEEATDSP